MVLILLKSVVHLLFYRMTYNLGLVEVSSVTQLSQEYHRSDAVQIPLYPLRECFNFPITDDNFNHLIEIVSGDFSTSHFFLFVVNKFCKEVLWMYINIPFLSKVLMYPFICRVWTHIFLFYWTGYQYIYVIYNRFLSFSLSLYLYLSVDLFILMLKLSWIWPFGILPINLLIWLYQSLSNSLLSGTHTHTHTQFVLSCSSSEISHFSKKPASFYREWYLESKIGSLEFSLLFSCCCCPGLSGQNLRICVSLFLQIMSSPLISV